MYIYLYIYIYTHTYITYLLAEALSHRVLSTVDPLRSANTTTNTNTNTNTYTYTNIDTNINTNTNTYTNIDTVHGGSPEERQYYCYYYQ